MAGDREQVDRHRIDVEWDLAEGLCRVGVEQNAPRAAKRADLGQRLQHADLVVRRHHGNDSRALAERGLESREVDQAIGLDRQDRHPKSFAFQSV